MIKGLYEAASGLLSEARAHEIRANNLANINTVGFKKDTPFFRLLAASGSSSPHDPKNPSGVVVGGTATDFSQGPLKRTGNPLDLALDGDGFFVVKLGDKEAYTRAGNFKVGPGSKLLDQNGLPVLAEKGVLNIPAGAQVTIDSNGEVFANGSSIGTLKVMTFDDKSVLKKVGNSLWVDGTGNTEPKKATGAKVQQGFLEMSNANVIEEMVSMIDEMRHFEAHQKAIRSILDDTVGRTINSLPSLK
ncbi:MAG: flagellar basal-body rod protein FlgF [Candidatus Coatesbacteria bacterium]|nr:MAG: flagellar basal-body rod protein FlgF [Candidatus Coatesbacteria bacterium]